MTEKIQGFTIAQQLETNESALMQVEYAHVTLSEIMRECVLAAFARALHV